MAEKNVTEMTLEERVKTLERLHRNARIAIIILVGYFIYDVISRDSGSDIIYAYKIKAKQFELVDGVGTIFASWKVLDEEKLEGIEEEDFFELAGLTATATPLRDARLFV